MAKRGRQRSKNVAIALALLALVVVMFLVTIVKLEEQVHRDRTPQTWEETKQPHVLTSDFTVYAIKSETIAASVGISGNLPAIMWRLTLSFARFCHGEELVPVVHGRAPRAARRAFQVG